MKKIRYKVEGVKCSGCVAKIEKYFKDNLNIEKLSISVRDKEVLVQGNDELSNIVMRNGFQELGFTVVGMKREP